MEDPGHVPVSLQPGPGGIPGGGGCLDGAGGSGWRWIPAKEILPLIGSKDGIAHLPFGFLNPGDAALIPDPGYQPYKGGVWLAGGEPILVPLKAGERLPDPPWRIFPPQDVARSKILYLNYPNNPTTALASREYLKEAVDFCHDQRPPPGLRQRLQ